MNAIEISITTMITCSPYKAFHLFHLYFYIQWITILSYIFFTIAICTLPIGGYYLWINTRKFSINDKIASSYVNFLQFLRFISM